MAGNSAGNEYVQQLNDEIATGYSHLNNEYNYSIENYAFIEDSNINNFQNYFDGNISKNNKAPPYILTNTSCEDYSSSPASPYFASKTKGNTNGTTYNKNNNILKLQKLANKSIRNREDECLIGGNSSCCWNFHSVCVSPLNEQVQNIQFHESSSHTNHNLTKLVKRLSSSIVTNGNDATVLYITKSRGVSEDGSTRKCESTQFSEKKNGSQYLENLQSMGVSWKPCIGQELCAQLFRHVNAQRQRVNYIRISGLLIGGASIIDLLSSNPHRIRPACLGCYLGKNFIPHPHDEQENSNIPGKHHNDGSLTVSSVLCWSVFEACKQIQIAKAHSRALNHSFTTKPLMLIRIHVEVENIQNGSMIRPTVHILEFDRDELRMQIPSCHCCEKNCNVCENSKKHGGGHIAALCVMLANLRSYEDVFGIMASKRVKCNALDGGLHKVNMTDIKYKWPNYLHNLNCVHQSQLQRRILPQALCQRLSPSHFLMQCIFPSLQLHSSIFTIFDLPKMIYQPKRLIAFLNVLQKATVTLNSKITKCTAENAPARLTECNYQYSFTGNSFPQPGIPTPINCDNGALSYANSAYKKNTHLDTRQEFSNTMMENPGSESRLNQNTALVSGHSARYSGAPSENKSGFRACQSGTPSGISYIDRSNYESYNACSPKWRYKTVRTMEEIGFSASPESPSECPAKDLVESSHYNDCLPVLQAEEFPYSRRFSGTALSDIQSKNPRYFENSSGLSSNSCGALNKARRNGIGFSNNKTITTNEFSKYHNNEVNEHERPGHFKRHFCRRNDRTSTVTEDLTTMESAISSANYTTKTPSTQSQDSNGKSADAISLQSHSSKFELNTQLVKKLTAMFDETLMQQHAKSLETGGKVCRTGSQIFNMNHRLEPCVRNNCAGIQYNRNECLHHEFHQKKTLPEKAHVKCFQQTKSEECMDLMLKNPQERENPALTLSHKGNSIFDPNCNDDATTSSPHINSLISQIKEKNQIVFIANQAIAPDEINNNAQYLDATCQQQPKTEVFENLVSQENSSQLNLLQDQCGSFPSSTNDNASACECQAKVLESPSSKKNVKNVHYDVDCHNSRSSSFRKDIESKAHLSDSSVPIQDTHVYKNKNKTLIFERYKANDCQPEYSGTISNRKSLQSACELRRKQHKYASTDINQKLKSALPTVKQKVLKSQIKPKASIRAISLPDLTKEHLNCMERLTLEEENEMSNLRLLEKKSIELEETEKLHEKLYRDSDKQCLREKSPKAAELRRSGFPASNTRAQITTNTYNSALLKPRNNKISPAAPHTEQNILDMPEQHDRSLTQQSESGNSTIWTHEEKLKYADRQIIEAVGKCRTYQEKNKELKQEVRQLKKDIQDLDRQLAVSRNASYDFREAIRLANALQPTARTNVLRRSCTVFCQKMHRALSTKEPTLLPLHNKMTQQVMQVMDALGHMEQRVQALLWLAHSNAIKEPQTQPRKAREHTSKSRDLNVASTNDTKSGYLASSLLVNSGKKPEPLGKLTTNPLNLETFKAERMNRSRYQLRHQV